MDPAAHLAAFVAAFVVPANRDRWAALTARRGRRVGRKHGNLYLALDPRFATRLEGLPELDPVRSGVWYDFGSTEPEVLSAATALSRGDQRDALFSLAPGRLAVYFWHEGGCWVCRR